MFLHECVTLGQPVRRHWLMKHRITYPPTCLFSLCFPLGFSSWPWCGLKAAEAFSVFITLPRLCKRGAGGVGV